MYKNHYKLHCNKYLSFKVVPRPLCLIHSPKDCPLHLGRARTAHPKCSFPPRPSLRPAVYGHILYTVMAVTMQPSILIWSKLVVVDSFCIPEFLKKGSARSVWSSWHACGVWWHSFTTVCVEWSMIDWDSWSGWVSGWVYVWVAGVSRLVL